MAACNFWIVKGNPRYPLPGIEERCGDIASFLDADTWSDWITYRRVPTACKKNDPVFFWSSGKLRSIVALGKIRNPHIDGHVFEITHLSQAYFPPDCRLGIQEIRDAFSDEQLASASYLKPSVVATIYPVPIDQASTIVDLLRKKNPDNPHLAKWSKFCASVVGM